RREVLDRRRRGLQILPLFGDDGLGGDVLDRRGSRRGRDGGRIVTEEGEDLQAASATVEDLPADAIVTEEGEDLQAASATVEDVSADAIATEEGEDLLADLLPEDDVPPDAPPLTHVALHRPDGTLVARIGGVDRPVAFVGGVLRDEEGEALVLLSSSRVHGCTLGLWRPLTGELRWTPMSSCVSFPTMAGGRLFGEAALAAFAGDEAPDDAEIVEVDLATGRVTPLTTNAVRERYVKARALPDGRVRLAFERIPERRFRRFPHASVCWADAPAPVAPPAD
ncbi:MAG: hypothetical protein AAGH15_18615, partial [Myxococcota bacterium]